MAKKPARSRAGMDAEAVARMMAEQEQDDAAGTQPVEPQPISAPPTYTAPGEPRSFAVTAPAPKQPEPVPSPVPPPAPEFDPGRVDGRTLRRTGREAFATRIRPETHQALRRIAYNRGITIAEVLEMAVAAFERG